MERINRRLERLARPYQLIAVQSNAESELIERIHAASSDGTRYILFNPSGFTHSSIVLRDALLAVALPFIEIHLSNVHAREPFRHHSYFSDVADGVISGFGAMSYELALRAAMHALDSNNQPEDP